MFPFAWQTVKQNRSRKRFKPEHQHLLSLGQVRFLIWGQGLFNEEHVMIYLMHLSQRLDHDKC